MGERIQAGLSSGSAASEGRRFGVQVGLAFIVLGGLASWRGRHRTAVVFVALGALLLMLGLIVPALLAPVNRAWMALARAISKITQPVFLGVVYFIAFLPVGLLLRLFRRSAIARDRNAGTFWVSRPPGARRSRLERQF